MILLKGVLLTMLWTCAGHAGAVELRKTDRPVPEEIPEDSLQRQCGGILPLYTRGKQIWMEIPQGEIRVIAQLDRGAGMRNRPLRSLPPFRVEAAAREAWLHVSDTAGARGFVSIPLPVSRIAGTKRRIAEISRHVYASGLLYSCSGGILRQQRYGHESLLQVYTTKHGTLLRFRSYYDVEAPDRRTEIQMPAGALPLELSLYLTCTDPVPEQPGEVIVGATMPEEYVDLLNEAVGLYNSRHQESPLHLVEGTEVISPMSAYGISFDVAEERITTTSLLPDSTGKPGFVRINLGSTSWKEEALRYTLYSEIPYREKRELLVDALQRRRICLLEVFDKTLEEAFNPTRIPKTETQEFRMKREFRIARRHLATWTRFMHKDAPHRFNAEANSPVTKLYESLLAETQDLYIRLAEQSKGDRHQREIIAWIAAGLISDAEGRFSTPFLRYNSLTLSPNGAARRNAAVWKRVLAAATPESISSLPDLFGRTLEKEGERAFPMQDTCLGVLLGMLPEHPEFAGTIEALQQLYTRFSSSSEPCTAIFACMQRQRLDDIRNIH